MTNLDSVKKQRHHFADKVPYSQGYILAPCLFNLYAVCIMRHAGLEEAQAGIKIDWGNINNLRYADNTEKAMEEPGGLLSTGSLGVGHD